MINAELLKILCCPETRQPLVEADQGLIDSLNGSIQEKSLKNVGGTFIIESAESFLVTSDKSRAYPVRAGIPVLLVDEGIIL